MISFKYFNEATYKPKKAKPIKKHGKKKLGQNPGDGGLGEVGFGGGAGLGESVIYKSMLQEMQLKFKYEDEEEIENLEDTSGDKDSNKPEEDEENPDETSDDNNQDNPGPSDEPNSEDADKQGLIRKIDKAHLVYKRQTGEGTYDELWIYLLGDGNTSELEIKKEILAGTDIDPESGESEDGIQTYDIWTAGNAQLLIITGLPN